MIGIKKYYVVVECTTCRRPFLAMSTNETRTCPYCGKRVRLKYVRVIARTETAEAARIALQDLKTPHDQRSSSEPT